MPACKLSFTLALAANLCCALWCASARAAIEYTVTDLGTLGGGYSAGAKINASGQVTGWATLPGDTVFQAFLWTPTTPNGTSGTMKDLGTLGGTSSYGAGINDGGQVAGTSYTTGNGQEHAFLYDGTLNDLGTLGGTFSVGLGINASGQVTGQSRTTGDAAYHAYLYDGTMNDLDPLSGSSRGYAINDSGQVTGFYGSHAFLYDGTIHDLGSLGGSSSGWAINESGQVTGYFYLTGTPTAHAFLWTPTTPNGASGTMNDLGTLGGTSSGYDINASAHVVGESYTTGDAALHAFLYTSGPMVDLNSLIDPLSGWTLRVASGINDAGQITGAGYLGGANRAFLLNPVPEPSTLALAAVGLLTGLAFRRRGRGI